MEVKSISSFEYQTKAKRPKNSRLGTDLISNQFNFKLPDWKQTLNLVFNEYIHN
ncbi:MAG: sugar nucleotide-binding protein [Bacillota bacterium]